MVEYKDQHRGVAQFRPEDDQLLAEASAQKNVFTIYILKSLKNEKSYVGVTEKNVTERVKEHNQGSNVWTRHNRPFKLRYFETYVCKEDALRREKFFKSGVGKKLKKVILEHF